MPNGIDQEMRDPIAPLDKASNTNDLLDILKHEHDMLLERKTELSKAWEEMVNFYAKRSKEVEERDGVIWQYAMEGQVEFQKNVFELDIATSTMYKVVVENSIKLFSAKSSEERMGESTQNQQPQIQINPEPKREISLLPRFGTKKKEPSLNEFQKPYIQSNDIIMEAKQIPQIFLRWNDNHSRGMIWCKKIKGKIEAQERYKMIEFTFFTGKVRPMLNKLIGARTDLMLEKEKDIVTEALMGVYRGIERNRNNMLEQMQKG